MDSAGIKKPHKFFERFLDNDLDDLYEYLEGKLDEMLDGKLGIPESQLQKYTKYTGAATQLGQDYNVFLFDHPGIKKLQEGLRSAIEEASEYYELDKSLKFKLRGWFNFDQKTDEAGSVNPTKDSVFFHDHMGGEGAPVFHGYYAVHAEPSVTFYDIDRKGVIFENINKNNRLILSETGHPHGRDDWYDDKPRITIAYDISPNQHMGGDWIDL